MLKSKTGSRARGGEKGGSQIDFLFRTVGLRVVRERDGVTDTSVSCDVSCSVMDRCHCQGNKQNCPVLLPYYVVVAGRGANCMSLIPE